MLLQNNYNSIFNLYKITTDNLKDYTKYYYDEESLELQKIVDVKLIVRPKATAFLLMELTLENGKIVQEKNRIEGEKFKPDIRDRPSCIYKNPEDFLVDYRTSVDDCDELISRYEYLYNKWNTQKEGYNKIYKSLKSVCPELLI